MTIGHVGNRPINLDEGFEEVGFRINGAKAPSLSFSRGSIDHEYRLTKTVVTVGQWFEFVQAFTPSAQDVLTAGRVDSGFTDFIGRSIRVKNFGRPPGVDPIYEIAPAANPNGPAIGMSWRFAARYVNWLNNGKALTRDAFSNGAYDETTFDPDTRKFDQATHNTGAQFWIPTLDEMLKGVYYDPNRYGHAIEGYWRQPDGGNEPLVSGRPGEVGAETSAGVISISPSEISVGSYPGVLSPLGLLDVSGGGNQLTEELRTFAILRMTVGTAPGMLPFDIIDNLGGLGLLDIGQTGLRIASVVPAPGGVVLLVVLGCCAGVRRQSRTNRNT